MSQIDPVMVERKVLQRLDPKGEMVELAVQDRASRGWCGVDQRPANARLLQRLRRDLLACDLAPPTDPPTQQQASAA